MRMASRIAAFFDLDNTIIPGPAIELRYFALLWRHRLVGVADLLKSAAALAREIPPWSFDPLRRHKAYLAGKSVTAIEAYATAFFWERLCPRIAAEARRTIDAHRAEHHHLILLTGSPEFLVAPLAAFLKIEHVAAGRLERVGGIYTGHMLAPYPYRQGKRLVAEHLAAELNLDLDASYMYGDSPGDLQVLETVGHPHVVNPIRGMTQVAQQRGWPILHWQ